MGGRAESSGDPSSVIAALVGVGGPFELVEESVLGVVMPVMRDRRRAVAELLEASVRWGERDYLVTADRRISFAEHANSVAALSVALRDEFGVGKGDRVAIYAANTPEWVIAFWATQVLGAITVCMNGWWVAREAAFGIEHSRPAVVIADAERAAVLADAGTGVRVLTMAEDLPAIFARNTGVRLPHTEIDEDDPAAIVYASGTSGRPKGALHSQRNILAVADYHRFNDAALAAFTGQPYDPVAPSPLRYLLTSPLFHIASLHNLVVPRLVTGSAVVMYQGKFGVAPVLRLIERERVTNWGAVPAMAARLTEYGDFDDYDLSSLNAFALASAPSSIPFKERLRERVPFARAALVDSYGLTECSTAVAVATPAELEQFPGTLGRPIIGVSLEIRDPEGNPVPDGDEGEVCVRSPYVMLGYWDDQAATDASITPERWLRTGDFGILENGMLRLVGRRSDLILRGGENVYPTEIEQCLDEHPDVLECVVIGTPHEDLGEEVSAVVVVRPGSAVTAEQLRDHVSERLSYFKVPSRWRFTEELLPRNATGKLIRRGITV
ncbi:class I adenylate-forming enzyme family protein [Nocardia macrotermitis]|uniref:2-succinylbenzoate--CoA ligase n=1 Tax=Nocardia macrotermitis TaxID=2585198 RepID=A0A7K0DEH7_9NOCA|nr:class I adenylate-forming enzyme family protein [Nocardia macrotermitis]MQY24205.1 2-succinylbenzoate--CoA ligase [Nocardia macrotermitis]